MKKLLQHGVVLGYLTITAGAFVFTMTKLEPPLPDQLVRWSYGMMAPYQGDTSWNADFVYEGRLPDGSWETIDVDPYMPYGFGERNVRKFLRVYARFGLPMQRRKFTEFGQQLLDRERARGRQYSAVRIFFESWPRSPAGYGHLRTPLFRIAYDLVTIAQ